MLYEVITERLVYFPSAWFCLGLAAALLPWLRLRRSRVFIPAAVVCGLAALSAITVKRNVDFRTPTALYLSDLKKDPQNILALP